MSNPVLPFWRKRLQQPQETSFIDWSNPITRGLVSAITPINGDVFKPSSPTFIGAGSIGPLTSGVAIKSTGGGGVNEVLYPVTFSAAGDRTIAVFASNIGGANSTVTHRVSDADSRDELFIGATSFSSTIDNNSPPSIGITESAMPRLYLARRRTNQVSAYANGTFTSESVTGTRQLDGTTFRFGRDGTLNSVSCQTYLTMYWKRYLTNAEITSLSNNPWQIFAPFRRHLFVPATSGAFNAAADGAAQAGGTASLAARVDLASVGMSVAGGSAGASVAVPLSAVGFAVSDGTANAVATVTISAAGLAQAVGSANLSGGAAGALDAAGQAQASGSATLNVTITLNATGGSQASGSASLSGGAPGQIAAVGGAQAGGSAQVVAMVAISAAGYAQAMASGQLSIQIPLTAFGGAIAAGSAHLTQPGSELESHPRFMVYASPRQFTAAAFPRHYTIQRPAS